MNVKRCGAAAVAIDNDRVLVVGGRDGLNYHCSGEIYDMRENSWTPISNDMPTRRYGCSGVLLEGNVYIIGVMVVNLLPLPLLQWMSSMW